MEVTPNLTRAPGAILSGLISAGNAQCSPSVQNPIQKVGRKLYVALLGVLSVLNRADRR